MDGKQYYNISGINTYLNPVSQDGVMIHAVNVVSFPFGAKSKRTGYSTFLSAIDSGTVQSLFEFPKNDGTTFFLYRKSGSIVYQSAQGTGAWTVCGNGTVDSGAYVGAAILDNTMIMGDGVGSTRHTTNGTSFTNTSLAPISPFFEQYQNRIYASGTAGDTFYSTTNDATNWNTSGTSDSSSFKIPGKGKNSRMFKVGDRLIAPKNSGLMYKWDGFNLVDMATRYGPVSPYAIGEIEGYRLYPSRFGINGFDGGNPNLLSNAIQRQFYNAGTTGIQGTAFPTLQGHAHIYDYFLSVGTVTDNFTERRMTNTVIKYDVQKNEFLNWDLASKPTAFLSFTDTNGVQQHIFGDASGKCYKFDGSYSDNGTAIASEMVFLYNYSAPEDDKKWDWFVGFFNPGCQAVVQVACSNTYTYNNLRWVDLGDVSDGVIEYRFPQESRSKFLFLRIYDSSTSAPYIYYGCSILAQIQKIT